MIQLIKAVWLSSQIRVNGCVLMQHQDLLQRYIHLTKYILEIDRILAYNPYSSI